MSVCYQWFISFVLLLVFLCKAPGQIDVLQIMFPICELWGKGQHGITRGVCDQSLMRIKDVSNSANKQEYFCLVWLILKILKNTIGKSREQYNKHPRIPEVTSVSPFSFFSQKTQLESLLCPSLVPFSFFLFLVLPLTCFRCLESRLLF